MRWLDRRNWKHCTLTWPPGGRELVHPGSTDPGLAVSTLQDDRDGPFPFLLVIGYGSHRDLLVDLTQETGGPYIYVHDYFDEHGIRLIFTGFADLLPTDPIAGPEQTIDDFKGDYTDVQHLALGGQVEEAGRAAAAMGHFVAGTHPVRVVARRPIR